MADFHARILENTLEGLHLEIDGYDTWFLLAGKFNAYNILAAYGCTKNIRLRQTRYFVRAF